METKTSCNKILLHGKTLIESPGIFVKLSTGEFLRHEGGQLPGSRKDHYLRVPAPVTLLVGPVIGGLFVIFLPVIGLGMAVCLLIRGIGRGIRPVLSAKKGKGVFGRFLDRHYLMRLWSDRKRAEEEGQAELAKEVEELAT